MNVTDDFSNKVDSLTFNIMDKALTKCFYTVIVLSTTLLAAWALGELFSVGGFTSIEITLLAVFSSTFLRFAAAFWILVIEFAAYMLTNPSVDIF